MKYFVESLPSNWGVIREKTDKTTIQSFIAMTYDFRNLPTSEIWNIAAFGVGFHGHKLMKGKFEVENGTALYQKQSQLLEIV
jgi:hypothetical protein